MAQFPKPYVNDVKQDDAIMEYVKFDTMGIGARKSGMPATVSEGTKPLDHVGKSATGRK